MATATATVTNKDFLENAPLVNAIVDGEELDLEAREFSSGSVGYQKSFKTEIRVNGKIVKFQGNILLTKVGSKKEAEQQA